MWQTKYAWLYLNFWDWVLIFSHAVKVIFSPGVRKSVDKSNDRDYARYPKGVIKECLYFVRLSKLSSVANTACME